MQKYIRGIWLLIFLGVSQLAHSTHIRAIEITARRISPTSLTFEFLITGYRDVDGVNFSAPPGIFNFGDGRVTQNINWTFVEELANDTQKWQFVLTHEYSGPGAFTVSYEEPFRNDGVINMANSVNTNYYTESLILIDPLIGLNSTPILTVPPIDLAASGLVFIHNPGAFDPDGDSLSYRLSIPLQSRNQPVTGYQELTNPVFYGNNYAVGNSEQNGPPTLKLDSITGDLIWDAPGDGRRDDNDDDIPDEYNVSFIVEEWRKINGTYYKLGYVTRDMQIIVVATDNEKPELTPPDDLCVSAGTFIDDTLYSPEILGTDPDNDPVTLSAFGGPFEVIPAAEYEPFPPQPQGPPGILSFTWDTDCQHIRARPYEIRLKIEDNPLLNMEAHDNLPAPTLVDFETWNITVVGPAPTNLVSTLNPNQSIQLDWDVYSCPNDNAKMQIWRKVGEYDFLPDSCEIGIPENAGYKLIATLPINQKSYLDNANGNDLAPGANYCYRLVAEFADPAGGTSYASNETCQEVLAISPLITKVDVISTDASFGEIRVEWIEPPDLDTDMFPGPYSYDLLRSTTENSIGPYVNIAQDLTDLFYVDPGLNTRDQPFHYQVVLKYNDGQPLDTSFAASTVWLELKPKVGSIDVTWSAEVPWSIQIAGLTHEVYRDNVIPGSPDELALIGTVEVTENGLLFRDDGTHNGVDLDEETFYCYYVRTQGSYDNDNPDIPDPLINYSQIQCAQPNDEEAPCTPINFMFDESVSCEVLISEDTDCEFNDFKNQLLWEEDLTGECDDDVASFNIYFSLTGLEDSYLLIANVKTNSYTHLGLDSFNGCYKISAVDISGNESDLSEPICNQNCIFNDDGKIGYILPNVFTPNGDGVNDTFRAFGLEDAKDCPRFVLDVEFLVIDRTGKELYTYIASESNQEQPLFINWDGTKNNGVELPAGTYFYSANVTFDVLDPNLRVQTINGWVQIIR